MTDEWPDGPWPDGYLISSCRHAWHAYLPDSGWAGRIADTEPPQWERCPATQPPETEYLYVERGTTEGHGS